MRASRTRLCAAIILATCLAGGAALAQDADELAKQLSNPIASLISVPFQFNADFGLGPDGDGERYYLNVQPVVPISLSEDWNLISRTITPVIGQNDVFPTDDDQFGLGDITQSFFLSPVQPGPGGIIWGAGPVLLIPTATDDLLGSEKFGLGPTIVALKQSGPWTYGLLANHIWSVAGDDDRDDVSSTYMQPFLARSLGQGVTVNAAFEVDLRLGGRSVDRPAQYRRQQGHADRQPADQLPGRSPLLLRGAGRRSRLGAPLHGHAAFSKGMRDHHMSKCRFDSARKRVRYLTLALAIGAAATPASAETIGYGDAMGVLIQACGADVDAHCAGLRLGGGRIEACLQQNASQLSPQCVTTYNQVMVLLQERAAAQAAVPQLCAADVHRLCQDFREGEARMLRCLLRDDNVRRVSDPCNQAITNAGWR